MLTYQLDLIESPNYNLGSYQNQNRTLGLVLSTLKNGYFYNKLIGVDLIGALFLIPEEEMLPAINQNKEQAHQYFLMALDLFIELTKNKYKNKSDSITISGARKGNVLIGLDFYKLYFGSNMYLTIKDCIAKNNLNFSSQTIQRSTTSGLHYLRQNWLIFKECLITVSDPYYKISENSGRNQIIGGGLD